MDCFAEACHRARIRATRWLAMTTERAYAVAGFGAGREIASVISAATTQIVPATSNCNKHVIESARVLVAKQSS